MIYEIPEDVRYVDMAIYIDKHVYEENHDTEKIFMYLYHLANMLAHKMQFFEKHKYYEPFSIYAASRVYMRLTNRKQYEYRPDGTPKMKKVKSILNLLKKNLYFLKVDFEQQEYAQSLSREKQEFDANSELLMTKELGGIYLVEFEMVMHDAFQTCKKFLKTIPYIKSSSEWMNIYTSVLLTILNQITLRRRSLERLEELKKNNTLTQSAVNRFFYEEKYGDPILFHVDVSLKDYITVLTRQVKQMIARDLSEILETKFTEDSLTAELTAAVQPYEIGGAFNANTDRD